MPPSVIRIDEMERHHSHFTRYATRLIIPRTAGVSGSSTDWRNFLNPSPLTHIRCCRLVPIGLLTSVTFSVFPCAWAMVTP